MRQYHQMGGGPRTATKLDVFLFESLTRVGLGGCWEWPYAKINGYGVIRSGSRATAHMARAHRAAYERAIGPVPPRHDLHHECGNRACVNWTHLRPITRGAHMVEHDVWACRVPVTHCKHGHPFDERNTLHWRGKRLCRACSRIRMQIKRHGRASET
jgi:HNH endonuclease